MNVRLREAINAINQDTNGRVALNLFPNNQLGSDLDMMSQIRSGALELATFPGTVMSTLVPVTSITGVGFAFTGYDKVWAAMDGAVGKHIRAAIEKVAKTQPAIFLKMLVLLVPRELEITQSSGTKGMSDEQLDVMVATLEGYLARRSGDMAKVIEAQPEPSVAEDASADKP